MSFDFEPGTPAQPRPPRTSQYRGVHWCASKNMWRAEIEVNGIAQKLGRYHTEVEAARAYDSAAMALGVPERCNAWWAHTAFIQHHRTKRTRKSTMRIARA